MSQSDKCQSKLSTKTVHLTITGIEKIYPNGKKALKGLSFQVFQGEFISIIGPSGSGKSSMLRCLNRLVEPSKGAIYLDDTNILLTSKKELRLVRRKIGMVFQHYNLIPRLTVIENVLHGRLGYKNTRNGSVGRYTEVEKKEAFKLLKKLGLEEMAYQRCDSLSGGQKQRVGIARALMQKPDILLCDEPIASLDPKSSKIIMDYLKQISLEMGITCLVNLHQVDVALAYSDRIIGIRAGEKYFDGVPDELTEDKIRQLYDLKDMVI
ncbi:phosphonate ABC transporter ATP-binding protein [Vagococcus penaei]|uniref:phosphonate ABC transporter ATP-binding protein n=1 Tax=Vagococcus penaei TaxID=633807 RepID=UPI000F866690|nr:phosphonate ABC transporter ATP-binding protein [Vagococcus penaei]RST99979.1 phosphonate ABC transporter ATP-binding protein [Vagococcus penaei]